MTMHKTQHTPLSAQGNTMLILYMERPGVKKRIKSKPQYSFLGLLLKNHVHCFKLIIQYSVHQHMVPNTTAQVIFSSLHKLYPHPLLTCLHWLPSCLLTPHFKLFILHLKTKHHLPPPFLTLLPFPPSRAATACFAPAASLLLFPSCFLLHPFSFSLHHLNPFPRWLFIDTSHFFFLFSH